MKVSLAFFSVLTLCIVCHGIMQQEVTTRCGLLIMDFASFEVPYKLPSLKYSDAATRNTSCHFVLSNITGVYLSLLCGVPSLLYRRNPLSPGWHKATT